MGAGQPLETFVEGFAGGAGSADDATGTLAGVSTRLATGTLPTVGAAGAEAAPGVPPEDGAESLEGVEAL